MKFSECANPKRARAVIRTLMVVMVATPKRCINLPLNKLDITVPEATIIDIIPAKCIGTFKLLNIEGQPEPSSESGNPRLMNAR